MGGHITIAEPPFRGRIRKNYTIPSGREILRLLATFTFVYNRFACPSWELAAIAGHEETIYARLGGFTNHDNHILSVSIFKNLFLLPQ